MADTLNVIVGADTTGLEQGLDRAKGLLRNFSNAIINAAKNIGEFAFSLIGPQGVTLGLSAIGIALIKGVVEYGNFSAAVRSLTGDLTDQEKAQKTLREEFQKGFPTYAQQSGQLSLLSSLANDNTIGIKNQTAAQGLLRQEVDKVVKSQDLQKDNTTALSGEMLDYTRKVLLARVTLQGFNAVVSKTAEEFATAVTEGVTFGDYFVSAAKKIFGFTNALREGNISLAKQIAETDFATIAQQRYQNRIKQAGESLKNALAETEKYTRSALASGIALEDLLDKEVKVATAKKETTKASESAKNAASANRKEQDKLARSLEKQRQEWQKLQENFNQLKFPVPSDAEINKLFRLENPPETTQRQLPFNSLDLLQAQLRQEELDKQTTRYNQNINNLVNTFNNLLAPAVDTVFGALENGQNVFKALGQSLKALIVQLVATVAKAAILATILSLIPGGGAALGVAGSVAKGTGNFGEIFKNFLGFASGVKKASAPTFSGAAGINAGGIQLAGQVVFVQRGPDLVGVLNQGNARIGRVG